METGLSVGEVMTQRPVTVPENMSVETCARVMRDKEIGSLLVAQGEELLGIITQNDIINKVVAEGSDPKTCTAHDVMTEELITAEPTWDLFRALNLMKDHNIRHLPIVHEGTLVGFLTVKDILRIEPALFELVYDSIELREEDRKLDLRTSRRLYRQDL